MVARRLPGCDRCAQASKGFCRLHLLVLKRRGLPGTSARAREESSHAEQGSTRRLDGCE